MQKENTFFFSFSNRWSSESHHACMFGRVVTEEDEVNESIFDRQVKVRISKNNTKQKVIFFVFIVERKYFLKTR